MPFPLLISLNSRMSLEAGGERGGRAPFPRLALPVPTVPAASTAGRSPQPCHRPASPAAVPGGTWCPGGLLPSGLCKIIVAGCVRGGHVAGRLALGGEIAGCL